MHWCGEYGAAFQLSGFHESVWGGNGVLRQAIPFLDDEAGMGEMSPERHFGLESVLFRIAGTCALVFRWGDIESVAQ